MYNSIPISPPLQPQSHSYNYYSRVVQLTRLETTCGSTSPPLFVSLLPFPVLFPMHFQSTLFSQHTPLAVTNLLHFQWTTHKKNKFSVWLSSSHLGTHHRCALQQIFRPYYSSILKVLYTLKTTKVTAITLMLYVLRGTDK